MDKNYELIHADTILHTLNPGCSFNTLRKPCNNQRSRCHIAWLHVTNHLYHVWVKMVKQSQALRWIPTGIL